MFEGVPFNGTVVSKDHDKITGELMYRIHYEDDDEEDVSVMELKNILIGDEEKYVLKISTTTRHAQLTTAYKTHVQERRPHQSDRSVARGEST